MNIWIRRRWATESDGVADGTVETSVGCDRGNCHVRVDRDAKGSSMGVGREVEHEFNIAQRVRVDFQ